MPSPVMVQSVLGPVPSDELGATVTHEHLLIDVSCWWMVKDDNRRAQALEKRKLEPAMMADLRYSPFACRDNLLLEDEDLACAELQRLSDAGGRTVIDPTCRGMGRDHEALARISRATDLNVVVGTGYYVARSHPPEVANMSVADVMGVIVEDLQNGIDGSDVRSGFIGEIGMTEEFHPEEEKVLRGAARAQAETHVPLYVHLPGWFRLGHRVLDVIAEEGADPHATVLCHMNPSYDDPAYHVSLARRGAWLAWDMIGMDYFLEAQGAGDQCPDDESIARAIRFLIEAGVGDQLLLSGDVFLKMMLVHYGGLGYAHVLEHFLPRLRRHGVSEEDASRLVTVNPRRLFEKAAEPRAARQASGAVASGDRPTAVAVDAGSGG